MIGSGPSGSEQNDAKTAEQVADQLGALASNAYALSSQRFFKTGSGQYGEGDVFIGVRVPDTRKVVVANRDLPLDQVDTLAHSKVHEHRLAALLILVDQFKRAKLDGTREEIFNFYMHLVRQGRVNNWDLIDSSTPQIVGGWLLTRADNETQLLFELVASKNLWLRRVGILGSMAFINAGRAQPTLQLCELVLADKHDLIHKASGWMLREVGKRVSVDELRGFLKAHVKQMPRTMLRYSIEHLSPEERKSWLDA